jgi:hypothetical protein
MNTLQLHQELVAVNSSQLSQNCDLSENSHGQSSRTEYVNHMLNCNHSSSLIVPGLVDLAFYSLTNNSQDFVLFNHAAKSMFAWNIWWLIIAIIVDVH